MEQQKAFITNCEKSNSSRDKHFLCASHKSKTLLERDELLLKDVRRINSHFFRNSQTIEKSRERTNFMIAHDLWARCR